MLSKNKVKYIQSLTQKKFRDKFGVFIAEGEKLVNELMPFFSIEILVVDEGLEGDYKKHCDGELVVATPAEIKKISNLTTSRQVFAVFKKAKSILKMDEINDALTLCLDGIQDPGNLGTILRIADWFGIKNVVCSTDTVDVYNPKVIQASMGALARVKVFYQDLGSFFSQVKIPVFGTFLEGANIYKETLPQKGIIVMGNEGNGIRPEVEKFVDYKLFIPPFPVNAQNVESLNVGVATAILCAEFRRRL